MDPLTNECQQLAIEVFAQHGAPNTATTLAAARVIGDAFAGKIREREGKQPIGGKDFLSKEYALHLIRNIIPGYEASPRGVFEDIFSMLRQDNFLLRSLKMMAEQPGMTLSQQIQGTLKSLSTWVMAWHQYEGTKKS